MTKESRDEWVNKLWYIQIMEHYTIIKRKKVLTRYVNEPRKHTPSERSQTRKATHCAMPLLQGVRHGQVIQGNRAEWWSPRGRVVGNYLVSMTGSAVGVTKTFWN